MATTGEKLKRLRRAQTLTQLELAEKSGVAQSTIVSLERGDRKEPRPATLRKLSQALGVESIELLED
jgi:transcriptional regulator with XRE-family HTH domain